MNPGPVYNITPADEEYAVRVKSRRPVKRSPASSEFRSWERSRGMERAVLGSVLLVFLAVAIPQYVSYRRMAADITTRSSIREAVIALESYADTHGQGYAGADARALGREGVRVGSNQWLLVVSVPDVYWVLGQARGSSGLWVRSSKDSQDHLIVTR